MAEAGTIQPFAYFQLVFVSIMGFALFDERPDAWTIAGGALILAAGLYTLVRQARLAARPQVGRRGRALSYALCATPRSGSTLLCDLLADTGVAGRPDSFFRPQAIAEWGGRALSARRPDRQSASKVRTGCVDTCGHVRPALACAWQQSITRSRCHP